MQDDDKRQGEFLGAPYDLRKPTLQRFVQRMWNPGGPLIAPKAWGWGWTFNVAHPAGAIFLVGALALAAAALWYDLAP